MSEELPIYEPGNPEPTAILDTPAREGCAGKIEAVPIGEGRYLLTLQLQSPTPAEFVKIREWATEHLPGHLEEWWQGGEKFTVITVPDFITLRVERVEDV